MRARDNVANANDLHERLLGEAGMLLGMLADVTRLRLMGVLLGGERDVTALTEAVGAARPAVSQHLGKLRLAGLVTTRREGRRVVYAVADPHVARLVTEALHAAEHRVSDRPGHHDAVPVPRHA
ncbi:ArsR/SmtB family transcription factor [Actinoplanes aureus]|jgi:DNA-binding transcriptional ArsR family regulator|uniref:Helix-turn-helix transcriptional regulator n=1 Tax=Actinoplanes aureus TaxID=2792083 RepID=A0A931C791_9ACTN|nr:metalloregulator ArsR/SmtB family transcription factor [Actinoplanes aureus]MBG0562266.1 helix-turn-helix transcriptional regulator [Actinoplanes aureus]